MSETNAAFIGGIALGFFIALWLSDLFGIFK
jgi:hypothetical protein